MSFRRKREAYYRKKLHFWSYLLIVFSIICLTFRSKSPVIWRHSAKRRPSQESQGNLEPDNWGWQEKKNEIFIYRLIYCSISSSMRPDQKTPPPPPPGTKKRRLSAKHLAPPPPPPPKSSKGGQRVVMKGHTLKEALEYTPAPREKNKYTKLTSDERLQRLRQVNIIFTHLAIKNLYRGWWL